ncbi:MAG: 3'(2'),5'-bisphosphate nucleotidase CysQ [Aquificae bacterium]|nr:3'(2'),5'-bisphosphate nucleotidase CysQ [Aquificota bacterium]
MNINIEKIIQTAKEAGEEILKIYNGYIDVEYKEDKSPLTQADKNSHKVIENSLKKLYSYPILSEEGKDIPFEKRKHWEYFWLIDPLDGTKEFIKKNGQFTVNIALIHKNRPIFGVIFAPAIDTLYYGGLDIGAFKIENGVQTELVLNKSPNKAQLNIVASKSHLNEETQEFIDFLKQKFGKVNTVSIGSSLKICLVAEGKADIYPRLAPTMEWDTAAAHAVLNAVGGKILKIEHLDDLKKGKISSLKELEYNKENLLNPYFVAIGRDVF